MRVQFFEVQTPRKANRKRGEECHRIELRTKGASCWDSTLSRTEIRHPGGMAIKFTSKLLNTWVHIVSTCVYLQSCLPWIFSPLLLLNLHSNSSIGSWCPQKGQIWGCLVIWGVGTAFGETVMSLHEYNNNCYSMHPYYGPITGLLPTSLAPSHFILIKPPEMVIACTHLTEEKAEV